MCHGDEAPDACGAVCIYDPASNRTYVADVEDFKIYEGVVVGATTRGDFFLLDETTRAVERFARREELARAIDRRDPAELGGRLEKLAMVYGGYSWSPSGSSMPSSLLSAGGGHESSPSSGAWPSTPAPRS